MGFTYTKAAQETKRRIRIELPESLAVWVDDLAAKSGDSASLVVEACVRFAMDSQNKIPRGRKSKSQKS